MANRGEVLVAIMNRRLDFETAVKEHWYRIPVSSQKKWLKDRWPPQWLAFYMTRVFEVEKYSIRYYARVLDYSVKRRWQLLPNEPRDERSKRRYYQLILAPIKQLPRPIVSRRWRRIVFIPTTWQKLIGATEINDLYDDSPLEDLLWTQLKRLNIPAERQEFITIEDRNYSLDFAIYCARGNLDVETDGDLYHANSEKSVEDNRRNNDLEAAGWNVLRFSTLQIREKMEEDCIYKIRKTIDTLGGIEEGGVIPRQIPPDLPSTARQMSLFDEAKDNKE